MPHRPIEPVDESRYYEGDAIQIPFIVYEHDTDQEERANLSGASVRFFAKVDRTDSMDEAIVIKEGADGANGTDVVFPDAENGEARIHIQTDDTEGALTREIGDEGETTRLSEDELFWVAQVIDADGNRVTTVEGTWIVHAL